MRVFRIAGSKYIADLQGTGSKMVGGRWNSKGTAILYTASSIALSAWEVRVHMSNKIVPARDAYSLATIEIPDDIFDPGNLNPDWRSNILYTKALGDKWAADGKYACLKVPSAIMDEYNFLVNPSHSHTSQIELLDVKPFLFDPRTFNNDPSFALISPSALEYYNIGCSFNKLGSYANAAENFFLALDELKKILQEGDVHLLPVYENMSTSLGALGDARLTQIQALINQIKSPGYPKV
jgi:RES domain-containing protein